MAGRKSWLLEEDVILRKNRFGNTAAEARCRSSILPALRDVHDLMFKNEEIRLVLARQPDHVPIVVFDPAVDDFAVRQLDADWLLLFAQRLQIRGLLRGFFGRSDLCFARCGGTCFSVKYHNSILHAAAWLALAGVHRSRFDARPCPPEQRPRRLLLGCAPAVPFTDPGVPVSAPLRGLLEPSKLAKFMRLKSETPGWTSTRSLIL